MAGDFTATRESVIQKNMTVLNIYAPNKRMYITRTIQENERINSPPNSSKTKNQIADTETRKRHQNKTMLTNTPQNINTNILNKFSVKLTQ